MAPCKQCAHARGKFDADSPDDGFLECKPPIEPRLWLVAFYAFAATGTVSEPFNVCVTAGIAPEAWPFQFHAKSIDRCDGFLAKTPVHANEPLI